MVGRSKESLNLESIVQRGRYDQEPINHLSHFSSGHDDLGLLDVGAKSFKGSKPNIVLIISDDQDNEHFGFMGNKTVRTLNLDKLAAAGTILQSAT